MMTMDERRTLRRGLLFRSVEHELDRAYSKHGELPWGRHEFYAILQEEVDELWDAIKADDPQELVVKELVQVAAMCFRYFETGDRYRDSPVSGAANRQDQHSEGQK